MSVLCCSKVSPHLTPNICAEEGFNGLGVASPIGPVPDYGPQLDGRDASGGFVFSTQRLDTEGRCVITDHKVA